MATPRTDVSHIIRAVKGEIADHITRGNKVEFVVPLQPNGTPNFGATRDADLNRAGIVFSVPETQRTAVFENILGIGPQDGEQNFAVTPIVRGRETVFTICAL